MFASAPENRMRVVRTVLLLLWFVLITSLFWDPLTPRFTDPDNLASPFRVDLSKEVVVQGKVLPNGPYPMGARIFWTMLIPIVPMFLMLFGHEAWRRICPLSLSTQLAQIFGFQSKSSVFNRKTGQVEKRMRLLKAETFMGRYLWFIQFGFLWAGITSRLLFMNSDRIFLACFLLSIIGMAVVVGFFFGGKTWCNYICPISVVQKVYTGPGGLLESKAYKSKGISQSMCRKSTPRGDQSTCVGCTTSCPDIDLERAYWDGIFKPGKRFAYYGYFGLVLSFYYYYYLYSGGWDYYFSGAWTHEDGQLTKLFAPGFYWKGQAIPIAKLIAAPLTTGVSVLGFYFLGILLEKMYGFIRTLLKKPLSPEKLRHHGLTFCAFATFNTFYFFAGRPNLNLLPFWLLRGVDVMIVFTSTLWFSKALKCGQTSYRRESLAQNVVRQLKKLKMDFTAILEGRTLEELNADEVHILAKTLSGLTDERKESLYRNVLKEALAKGEVSPENSLEAMKEIRQQMNISEEDHNLVVRELLRQDQGMVHTDTVGQNRLRIDNYTVALEGIIVRCLDSGIPVREELKKPSNSQEVKKLQVLFDISETEHQEILSLLLDKTSLILQEARVLLEEMADTKLRVRALDSQRVSFRIKGLELLRYHLENRCRALGFKFMNILASLGEGQDAIKMARWFAVVLMGQLDEFLDQRGQEGVLAWKDRLPARVVEALRDELMQSLEILKSDATVEDTSLRNLLQGQLRSLECLVQIARGFEQVPAALALYVLDQLAPEQGQAVAKDLLGTTNRHWLIDEVILSVTNKGKEKTVNQLEGYDYMLESIDTVSKMLYLFRSTFFRHLSLEVLASLARNAELRVYRQGGLICRTGDRADRVFVICKGHADVCIEQNKEYKWVDLVGEGDSIGELGIFTDRPRSATVIATQDDTRLMSIDDNSLLSMLNQNPKVAMSFLRLLSNRQQTMLARMVER